MKWYTCVECGHQKLIGALLDEETYTCSNRCEKRHKKGVHHIGPLPGVGQRSMTAKSKREAKKLNAIVGGKVVPGSGAVQGLDGDRITARTMIEEKVTDKKSYTLTSTTWEKLLGEAARNGLLSALILKLGPHRIVMMPLDEAMERMEGEL